MKTLTKQQKEIRSAFANYVAGKLDAEEARSLGVKTSGGKISIPKVVANEIIGYVEEHNPLRKYGKVVTVEGNLQYPVLTNETDIKVEVNSAERDEDNEIEVNRLGLKAELLEPVEFDSISTIKRKLITITPVSVTDLVMEVMKKEYLKKELDYMFNGTDAKAFNSGSLLNKAKVFTPLDTDPVEMIKEMKNKPSSSVTNNARWIVNKKAIEFVEDLILPNGTPVLKTMDHEGSGVKYLILGFPVDVLDIIESENKEKAVFYFGDFSSFVIQEAFEGLEVESLFERYILQNEIGFKLYQILDGKLIYSELEPTVYRMEI